MKLAFENWRAKKEELGKIVLLHGMAGRGKIWRPIAASLEDDFSILAPDQRGHGGSQHIKGKFTPLDFGQDVLDTLQENNFYPTWVIGHSMGVRSACAAAHLKPEWFKGLVLIDIRLEDSALSVAKELLFEFLKTLPDTFPDRAAARKFLTDRRTDPSLIQFLMAVSEAHPDQGIYFPFDKSSLLETLQSNTPASLIPWIEELAHRKMPVLFLRGGKSHFWKKPEFEADRARFSKIPFFEFEEFEASGHGLPFEERARFVNRIKEWIKKYD